MDLNSWHHLCKATNTQLKLLNIIITITTIMIIIITAHKITNNKEQDAQAASKLH